MTTNLGDVRPILVVDDDPDDLFLAEKALRANRVTRPIQFLEDGEELLDYLRRKGKYSDPALSPQPCLVLLDLNMPRMDGRKALGILKEDPGLRRIPAVVLTTSRAEEDVDRSYGQGANSFITKPVDFNSMVSLMGSLKRYWLEIVELPPAAGSIP